MATMGDEPVFLDTNVLVYASIAEAPLHTTARTALHQLAQAESDLWISRQVVREYLATLTRPQTFTPPLPAATVIAEIRDFLERFHLAEDSPQVTEQLLSLVERFAVGGKQVHDANIVATMLAHDIRRLWTYNTGDFARYAELITVLPIEPVG